MADELFALKTNFYIGAHQAVISEALTVSPSTDAVRIERDFFMYRAYVEQAQYHLVKDEVGADAPASLQAVKLLATYLSSPRDAKETCLLQLKEWLADANAANNWHLQVIAATVYCAEADYKSALGAIHQSSQLDCMALVAHIYLAMQRPDLAKKQLGLLQEADDDATLTKLVAAWVALSEGSDKAQARPIPPRRSPSRPRASARPPLPTDGVPCPPTAGRALRVPGARRPVLAHAAAAQRAGGVPPADGQVRRGGARAAGGDVQVGDRPEHARQHGGDDAPPAQGRRRRQPRDLAAARRRLRPPVAREARRARGRL